MHNKARLTLLLFLLFGVNYIETGLETWLTPKAGPWIEYRNHLAAAALWLEHDLTLGEYLAPDDNILVYGYSICYFFLFPALILGTGLALLRRSDQTPYRIFVFSILAVYGLSFPFFLFFPMPERWTYPEAGTLLLSDLWTPRLIESIRHISSLDNCFPSSHVALTVVSVFVCFLFRVRFRISLLIAGIAVLCSTFLLGIHWLADIVAGLAVGLTSVILAIRVDQRLAVSRSIAPPGRPAWEVKIDRIPSI